MSLGPVSPGGREAPGWYGKLATLGDFAQRRLPPEFVQTSDTWLARAMSASHQQLGDRWLDVYLTAPVMRFAWAPGVADASWWFGLLMPSCDSVGRYFPLLIAQRRAQPPQDRIALNHLEAWYDHLAHAATQTLSERASIDAFEEALGAAPPWPTPGAQSRFIKQAIAGGERHVMGARSSINDWLADIAVDDLQSRFKGCSIWWRQSVRIGGTAATVLAGLPDPSAFAEMLSGRPTG